MNGVGKCFKIGQVAGLRQIVRKCRKLASACDGVQAVACRLLSSWSCRVCYVSDDRHVDVVRMKKSNKGYRRSQSAIPPDVPPGHLPVYVGQQCSRRFVIRVAYLNHPMLRTLLDQAEEEFGYIQLGGLVLPCDELLFEHILRFIERQGNIVAQGFNTSSPTSLQRNP